MATETDRHRRHTGVLATRGVEVAILAVHVQVAGMELV
jgi:hypothetical protein